MRQTLPTILFLAALSFHAHSAIVGGVKADAKTPSGIINLFFMDKNLEATGASCTATKITPKHILTAAHCVDDDEMNTVAWNNQAEINLEKEEDILGIYVKKVTIHPSYRPLRDLGLSHTSTDIAIIEVDDTKGNYLKNFQNLQTVDLDFSYVAAGELITSYGYGCTKSGDLESPLVVKKQASFVSLGIEELQNASWNPRIVQDAKKIYQSRIVTPGMSHGSTASLCEGDSGGPVLKDGKVVGVNSAVVSQDENQSAETDSYLNFHSRISGVRPWIESIIKNK